MAKINPNLLSAIIKSTGLSRPQVYARIKQVAHTGLLPRHLAAIKFAAESGVTINKYATAQELAELRLAGSPAAPPNAIMTTAAAKPRERGTRKSLAKAANQVFVVHGRDKVAKEAIFAFLRAVGVKPIEWVSAVAMTKKPAPYIGEILEVAFSKARAVVVLLTP